MPPPAWIDEPLEFGKPQPSFLELWHDAPIKVPLKDYPEERIFEAMAWNKRGTKKSIGTALEKGKPIAPFVTVNGKPDFRQALVLPWKSDELLALERCRSNIRNAIRDTKNGDATAAIDGITSMEGVLADTKRRLQERVAHA